jgi:hypothetical protein
MPLELAAVEESSLPTDVNMCHVFMSSSIKVRVFRSLWFFSAKWRVGVKLGTMR